MTSFRPETRTGQRPDEMDEVVLTGHQIYTRIHGGRGIATLVAAGEAAETLARRYEQRQARIIALRRRMTAAWEGDVADTARTAMSPLVKANEETVAQLETAIMALGTQAGSYRDTFNAVEPVPEGVRGAGLDDANPYAVDVDGMVDEYRNKASKNVWVYNQYVSQSQLNGNAMPQPYATIPEVEMPTITVRRAADDTASGGPSTRQFGDETNVALSADGKPEVASRDRQPATFSAGQPGAASDPPAPSSPGGPATQPEWGPNPSPAGGSTAGGTTRRPRFPRAGGKEPDTFGGTANLGTPGRVDRGSGTLGPSDEVAHRSVLRPATQARVGDGSAPGGMWGSLPPGAPGEDDTEHTRRYGRYLDPNELFASDAPVAPAVIGLESDDAGEDE